MRRPARSTCVYGEGAGRSRPANSATVKRNSGGESEGGGGEGEGKGKKHYKPSVWRLHVCHGQTQLSRVVARGPQGGNCYLSFTGARRDLTSENAIRRA